MSVSDELLYNMEYLITLIYYICETNNSSFLYEIMRMHWYGQTVADKYTECRLPEPGIIRLEDTLV